MAAVNVTFPGNLAQVDTAVDLGGIPSTLIASGSLYLVSALEGVFEFDSGSVAIDDAATVIRPDDRSPLQAGRWLKSAKGLASGKDGDTGPADNTYATYAALLASDPTRKSARLVPQAGETEPAGNFNYIGGQWVRQAADGISYKPSLPSAVAVPASVKLSDAVSLVSFRLPADPIDDWAPSIQRGIDALSAAGGGALLIPPGVYPLKVKADEEGRGVSAFSLRSNVTLVGASKVGTVLKLANTQIGPGAFLRVIMSTGTIENVGITNLTVDGNRDGQGAVREQGNGGNIVLGHVRNCVIDNVVSKNANGQCIQIAAPSPLISELVTIENCLTHDASGSTLDAQGNTVALYNGNGIGIQVSRCKYLIIERNQIYGCRDNGIDTYSDDGPGTNSPIGGKFTIKGNNVSFCRTGIFPETSVETLVSGNYVTDCVEGGIFVNRIYGAPSAVTISDNMIGGMPVGIRVTGDCNPVIGVSVRDNTIYSLVGTQGAGVMLGLPGANVSYVDVSGNTFGVNNPAAPLISIRGEQAAFLTGRGNIYFGVPSPGLFVYNTAPPNTSVDIAGFLGVSDASVPELVTRWMQVTKLQVTGSVGFFGANPAGRQSLAPAATDAATTQALVNSIRSLLVSYGLGA